MGGGGGGLGGGVGDVCGWLFFFSTAANVHRSWHPDPADLEGASYCPVGRQASRTHRLPMPFSSFLHSLGTD